MYSLTSLKKTEPTVRSRTNHTTSPISSSYHVLINSHRKNNKQCNQPLHHPHRSVKSPRTPTPTSKRRQTGITPSTQKTSVSRKYVPITPSVINAQSLILSQLSSHTQSYAFTSSKPREKDSFGLDTGGRMMLVEAGKLSGLIGMMTEKYAVPK
jgi:hypothetical protein